MTPESSARPWRSALVGALVSLGLWISDVWSLGRLSFAGASDAEVQKRVVGAASGSLFSLEAQLGFSHVAFGISVGLLTYYAVRGYARRLDMAIERPSLFAGSTTLAVHVLALLGMVARYPQLFADRWWLGGGLTASLQRFVTHELGPAIFDGLLLVVFGALAIGVAIEGIPVLVRAMSSQAVGKLALPAAAVLVLSSLGAGKGSPRPDAPPDVLILAADSLRSDRLESPDVMPFAASLAGKGTLFRYAFTPIARTYPSWVSTLTGTEPRTNGVRHMFPTLESRAPMATSFFTELRDQGYYTFVVSDFAGDVFHGFEAGFETLDTPTLNVDTLVASTVLASHRWALPMLRFRIMRKLFPVWRNLPNLADPEWLVDEALEHIDAASERPYAGLVFFSTAHFPYAAPYPDYLRDGSD